jgi:hypothetical protein
MGIISISSFVNDFVNAISSGLALHNPLYRMTGKQSYWLKFCLMGLLLANSINWSAYSRLSLGRYSLSALSWMFRQSKINFRALFDESIVHILQTYGLSRGHLIYDDTDNERSKNALHIHGLGKQKDKKSGGYFQGQNIMFCLLVTSKVSIPVGFAFYENDPSWSAWDKEDKRLIKKGVSKAHRPKEVKRDYTKYPTKQQISLQLAANFKALLPEFKVLSVMADCFFGTKTWTDGMSSIFPKSQIISQLKSNQTIIYQNNAYNLKDYFKNRAIIATKIVIRAGKSVKIQYSSVIAKVNAHDGKKRLIVAYKYEGEEELRYVFATDMSWTPHHVIETYSLRWLIEVFISDWKNYEGWAVLTKHIGYEGSYTTLILSLLFDHCLLLHPEQQARVKNKLPMATVGSLRQKAIQLHFMQMINELLEDPDPKQRVAELIQTIETVFLLRNSSKHLNGKSTTWG